MYFLYDKGCFGGRVGGRGKVDEGDGSFLEVDKRRNDSQLELEIYSVGGFSQISEKID